MPTDTQQQLIQQLTSRLRLDGLTVASAESCTGGRIAALLTQQSGASDYFIGGMVTYQNRIKEQWLGVLPETIEKHDVVSEQVARQMALGVQQRSGAQIGIATTGYAGPTGGTPTIPVGTVCYAIAIGQQIISHTLHLQGDRQSIVNQAIEEVLRTLIDRLNP